MLTLTCCFLKQENLLKIVFLHIQVCKQPKLLISLGGQGGGGKETRENRKERKEYGRQERNWAGGIPVGFLKGREVGEIAGSNSIVLNIRSRKRAKKRKPRKKGREPGLQGKGVWRFEPRPSPLNYLKIYIILQFATFKWSAYTKRIQTLHWPIRQSQMDFARALLFFCSLLTPAALCTVATSQNVPTQPNKTPNAGSSSTGCGNVHINNYCPAPDEEILVQLLKIRTQLADIQQKVDSLAGNNSKSGRWNRSKVAIIHTATGNAYFYTA